MKNGALVDIKLDKSSGYESLDDAAISAVQKVGQFEPLPDEISPSFSDFAIPLSFQLR
jgi:TonB family protein